MGSAKRLLSVAWLACLVLIQATVYGQSTQQDTQLWNDVQIAVPVSKAVDFVLLGTLRLGRNISHPVEERIGIGLAFKLGKYVTIVPGYLNIRTQPFKLVNGYENRLNLVATVRFPIGGFTLSDRNLFERRLRHPGVDATRYRNRLQLDLPVELNNIQFTVFVADEVYYDGSVNDWVRNRFSVGVSTAWNKHLTTDHYYLRQNDGLSRPGDLHVIGSVLRVRL